MAAAKRSDHRTVQRQRTIPVTRNGRTRHVVLTDTVPAPPPPPKTPPPPRDWDHVGRGFVAAVALVLNVGSLVWCVVSVGGLLAHSAHPGVAFTVAAVFDLAWMMCLAAEYLLRYEPDRARPIRNAGWAALLIAMGATFAHAHRLSGSLVIGVAGAVLPLFAKGGWMVHVRVQARRLDDESVAWLAAERADVDTELALAAEELRIARKRSAVRRHREALGLTADTADTGTPTDTDTGHPAVPDTQDTDTATVLPMTGGRPGTIASTIRACLRDGTTDTDAVLSAVRDAHGQHVSEDTVRRTLRRVTLAG